MRRRQINCLQHPLTSRQILSMLLDFWKQDRRLPVVLITRKKDAETTVRLVRVTLSKERKNLKAMGAPVNYGFRTSSVFPFTFNGVKGEAIVIQWRLTTLQHMRNMREHLFGHSKMIETGDTINAN